MRRLLRDDLEHEMFGVRHMRHIFRFRRNLTLAEWRTVLAPLKTDATPHYDRYSRVDILLVNRSTPLLPPFQGTVRRTYSAEALAANFTPLPTL